MIETTKNETAGMNAIEKIDFHGQEVFAARHENGKIYVPVRKICDNLGIDFSAQRTKIAEDEVLNSTVVTVPTVASDGFTRDMFCLPLDMINGWLFQIPVNFFKGEKKEKIILYKKECYKALSEHFLGDSADVPSVDEAEFDMFRLIGKFGEMKRNPITEALAFAIRKPSSAETVLYRINHPEAAPHKVAKARGLSLRQVYTHLREGELNGVNGRMPDLVTRGEFESFKNETRSNENQLAVGLENTTEVLKSISQSFANIMDRLSARLEEQDRKLVSAPRAKSSAFRGFSGRLMSEAVELKRQGMRTRDIAASLGIGESTVRTYLRREREELNFNGNKI